MAENPTKTKKEKEEEKLEGPVTRTQAKEAKLLLKGVRKFLRYNDDLISEAARDKIAVHEADFREALENPRTEAQSLDQLARDLTRTCEKSVPDYKPSALRENIEVIFVAVVIAMGIRAYFAQPFKIPTGSMQPTLNGIVAHPHKDINPDHEYVAGYDKEPGWLQRAWEKFWYGRTYVNIIAKKDDFLAVHDSSRFTERTHFKFFTRTYIPLSSGKTYSIPGTISKVKDLINPALIRNPTVKKGDVIAHGYIDTGDQVIVDKFSYHWVKPKRGQVFVFTTNDIPYIQREIDPRFGSQHYIKRLAGTPGDHLKVESPNLYINGELAREFGFRRVMSQQNGYQGYADHGMYRDVELGKDDYFALGDNSYNSSDSRMWGRVPAQNIVGRALCVYLPFGHHFGRIR